MKEFRITLISDPTDKYPHSKNNNFKVRLPVLPNLEGNQWQASLWSLSVADVGQSPAVINTNNDVTLLKYRYTFTSRYQDTSNDWLIGFQAKGKTVTLKKKDGNLVSCHLRHSIMAQYCDSYGTNHDGRFKCFLGGLESLQK